MLFTIFRKIEKAFLELESTSQELFWVFTELVVNRFGAPLIS